MTNLESPSAIATRQLMIKLYMYVLGTSDGSDLSSCSIYGVLAILHSMLIPVTALSADTTLPMTPPVPAVSTMMSSELPSAPARRLGAVDCRPSPIRDGSSEATRTNAARRLAIVPL